MEISNLQKFIQTYKKGTYTKACWKSEKVINGKTYSKISNGVIRFVNYGSVKQTTTTNKNTNQTAIIKNVCFFNANTNNYLVHMFVSKNPNHKTKSSYYCNGIEISENEYKENVKSNNGKIDLMFVKKVQDIISLG